MATLSQRDDDELAAGFSAWCEQRRPDLGLAVASLARPSSGWSNEILFVTAGAPLVVRLPPPLPTFPSYGLGAQARLLDVLANEAVPVPRLVAYEEDAQWLGAPFLVMSREPGRPGPEVPALDPWLTESPPARQREVQNGLVDAMAAIHAIDWRARGLDGVLRGGAASITDEVAWWRDYIDWAADGSPTALLADAVGWCATTVPVDGPPASLCWGDARLGNVLFADDARITAVLDWELASIGPAEMDVAWYLALDELTSQFAGTVAGFASRDEVIDRYQHAAGRALVDLAWHEIFALTRSVAINERQARLAAIAGVPYPGVAGEANPVLRHLARRIDRFPA
jgi:aminoglycoside phosphotransferase (APT) family kinase protein